MAQSIIVNLPPGKWTLLTNSDVTKCTFQIASTAINPVLIAGTVGAVEPTTNAGFVEYKAGTGEYDISLSEMFPGIAATRLYAFSARATSILVSHA